MVSFVAMSARTSPRLGSGHRRRLGPSDEGGAKPGASRLPRDCAGPQCRPEVGPTGGPGQDRRGRTPYENRFDLVDCSDCVIAPACTLPRLLNEATRSFLAVLDSHTLADFLVRPDHLHRLFGTMAGRRLFPKGPRQELEAGRARHHARALMGLGRDARVSARNGPATVLQAPMTRVEYVGTGPDRLSGAVPVMPR